MKTANRIIMALAGILLLAGAWLKVQQLLTEPIISESFWESWAFFVIQIPLEIGLGTWLLSGLFRKAGWLIAVFSFGLFIVVTLQKTLAGAESCGCFGSIKVDPRITLFAIDIPCFLGLLIFRPKGEKLLPPPWPRAEHFFGVALPTFILLGAIVPILIANKQIKPDYAEQWTTPKPAVNETPIKVEPGQGPVVVEPNVVEQIPPDEPVAEWPWLKLIDIGDSLRDGMAIVLFYHNDCSDCADAIPVYEQMNSELADDDGGVKIAFVELPPHDEKGALVPEDSMCLSGKLYSEETIFVTTPFVVVIMDSSFIKSWEGVAPGIDEILDAVFGGD